MVLKAVHVRPDAKIRNQECCLKISLLPLRLNIDQDALLFLINFFNELGGNTVNQGKAIILIAHPYIIILINILYFTKN